MEKRTVLAIALSLLVLVSWSMFVSKSQPVVNKPVTESQPPSIATPEKISSLKSTPSSRSPASLLKFKQENFEVVFDEKRAAIKEINFGNYQEYQFSLKYGFLLGDDSLVFKVFSRDQDSITFIYNDENKKILKRFIFSNPNYNIELELEIENLSTIPQAIELPLVLGVLDFSVDPQNARFQDVTAEKIDGKILHLNARKQMLIEGARFLSLRDRYFCAIIEPEQQENLGYINKLNSKESEIGLYLAEIKLSPSQKLKKNFHIYLGPQDLEIINQVNPKWSAVMYFGMFDFISHILLQLLDFFHGIVNNWGWAIIILSVCIYLLLFPLSLKQMRSMKEMQALQPKIEELRKTYKDNPQKLNKEIMALYREHKVNPFGGCLPLILQIPVFIALYQALIRSIALKGAKFLWIKDLSAPDRLFTLPFSVPVLGNELNILPILMAIGMFVQQKTSSISGASGSTAEQQKMMMFLFPIMFGVIFYRMPSGLVLYWFTNSTFMLLYQLKIRRAK